MYKVEERDVDRLLTVADKNAVEVSAIMLDELEPDTRVDNAKVDETCAPENEDNRVLEIEGCCAEEALVDVDAPSEEDKDEAELHSPYPDWQFAEAQ